MVEMGDQGEGRKGGRGGEGEGRREGWRGGERTLREGQGRIHGGGTPDDWIGSKSNWGEARGKNEAIFAGTFAVTVVSIRGQTDRPARQSRALATAPPSAMGPADHRDRKDSLTLGLGLLPVLTKKQVKLDANE